MNIYYTVYQITNLINGKIYIGAHRTRNIYDDYMGSSKILRQAINKHGKENFSKEILHIFDNEDDMWNKEKELVTKEFCSNKNTYNIAEGGVGWSDIGKYTVDNKIGIFSEDYIKNKKPEVSRRTHIKLKREKLGIYGMSPEKRSENGKRAVAYCRENNLGLFGMSSEKRSENGIKGSNTCRERGVGLFGLTFEERSEISKKTQSEMCPIKAFEIRSKGGKIGAQMQIENKIGIFGRSEEERIAYAKHANNKQKELGVGFYSSETQRELGKRGGPKNKGFKWYSDDNADYKYTSREQKELSFEEFLEQNPQYKSGRNKVPYRPRNTKGRVLATNGVVNIQFKSPEERDKYIQENKDFRKGRTNLNKKNK